MTRSTLILRSLRYHWRNSLAVVLGVVVGAAVIVGALLVGDSVRFSLRKVALQRLGNVDQALISPRHLFREKIAAELSEQGKASGWQIAPALVLTGSAELRGAETGQTLRRAGQVQIYGVDDQFWNELVPGKPSPPGDGAVTINASLARHLQIDLKATDQKFLLQVEIPAAIPRDALLGNRDETTVEVPVKIAKILGDDQPFGNFGLRPDQQLPWNAFIDLKTLQRQLHIGPRRRSFQEPQGAEGRLNALLVSEKSTSAEPGREAVTQATDLTKAFDQFRNLSDLQLQLKTDPRNRYLSLYSDQMILDHDTATRTHKAGEKLGMAMSPALVYLVNETTVEAPESEKDEKEGAAPRRSMYAVAAGLDPALFTPEGKPPFGPFEFVGDRPQTALGEGDLLQGGTGEVLLNEWVAADLKAKVGDIIRLKFNLMGSHGELNEKERLFKLRGIVKLKETVADDRGLTPDVPGITDAKSLVSWRQPFSMKTKLITRRDEDYWTAYRATPKIFLTLKSAQHLWKTRYGDLTSIRYAPPAKESMEAALPKLQQSVLEALPSVEQGLAFRPVKYEALQAAAGTTDFTGLFLGFSMFLIFSAAVLIGLLFRLGVERRSVDIGLWLAVGFTPKQVRRLLLGEAAILVVIGVSLGVLAGIAYAATMIHGLNTWWVGAIGNPFLELHVAAPSVIAGWVGAAIASLLSVLWGLRKAFAVPVRALLAGESSVAASSAIKQRRGRIAAGLLCGSAVIGVLLLIALIARKVPQSEAFSGFSWYTLGFFGVGILVLMGSLAGFSVILDRSRTSVTGRSRVFGLIALGINNCLRNRTRSLLSATLIACATFLIVAMAVAHRDPTRDIPDRNSGNGGFTLLAESSIPILPDFNTAEGRKKLNLDGSDEKPAEQRELRSLLATVRQTIPFRVNPGENASCTNLYRPAQPTILGVTPSMISRGGFKFVGAREENPWSVLEKNSADGTIPVFGDMNTLMYSLKAQPGTVLEVRTEGNEPAKLKVAGMLDSSVFQGVLLMSEQNFLKLFPSRVGYQYFLFDVPPENAGQLGEVLESRVPGLSTESVTGRIATFLSVQNTYLSTFQTLGGLGLLLGTVGLGTVMLRNVLERRAELALLRAVGFQDASIMLLVLVENLCVLVWGLCSGAAAALLAMLPHITSIGAEVPWPSLGMTLLAVLVVGLLSSLGAIVSAVRTPVLASLRGE